MCKYPVSNNLKLDTELYLKGIVKKPHRPSRKRKKRLQMPSHETKAKYMCDSPAGSSIQKNARNSMPFLAITSPKTHKVSVLIRQLCSHIFRSIRPSDFFQPRLKKSCDLMVCSESIQHHHGASYLGTRPQECLITLCKIELETMLVIYLLKVGTNH